MDFGFEMSFVVLGGSSEKARGFGIFASHGNYIKEDETKTLII